MLATPIRSSSQLPFDRSPVTPSITRTQSSTSSEETMARLKAPTVKMKRTGQSARSARSDPKPVKYLGSGKASGRRPSVGPR